MGFFGKIFGGGPSVAALRKAVEQKNFSDARLLAEQLAEQTLPEAEIAEVEALRCAAGDGLARLNLNEAIGMRNCGEIDLADEHLRLALEQVCDVDLRQDIQQQLDDVPVVPEVSMERHSGTSCASCGPQPTVPLANEDAYLPDSASQIELVLTSYPAEFAERYRQKDETFLQAFLLSHSGDDASALSLWGEVAVSQQDELYWFEFGSAQARMGDLKIAKKSLEKALQLNAGFLLITESLVSVLIGLGEIATAEKRLQAMLGKGQAPAFCHAHLAQLYLQQQRSETAVVHIRQALAAGVADPSFFELAATVFEQAGELAEAEAVLQKIPGGGCGGGLSLPLAEFLLRQKRDLAKLLDTFNAACRKEPDNPRWQLRVAQTYIARSWNKDGVKLLKMLVGDPRLAAELQHEAKQLLAEQQG